MLLTLGRLPKALDVARSFKANGWRVIVAEPFKRHLLGASKAVAKSYRTTAPSVSRDRYLAELQQIIRDEGVALAWSRSRRRRCTSLFCVMPFRRA